MVHWPRASKHFQGGGRVHRLPETQGKARENTGKNRPFWMQGAPFQRLFVGAVGHLGAGRAAYTRARMLTFSYNLMVYHGSKLIRKVPSRMDTVFRHVLGSYTRADVRFCEALGYEGASIHLSQS